MLGRCSICNELKEDIFSFNYDYICQDCFKNYDGSYGVLPYSFKKIPYFYKTQEEKTKRFFGFELEISNAEYCNSSFLNRIASDVRQNLNSIVYCKNDLILKNLIPLKSNYKIETKEKTFNICKNNIYYSDYSLNLYELVNDNRFVKIEDIDKIYINNIECTNDLLMGLK